MTTRRNFLRSLLAAVALSPVVCRMAPHKHEPRGQISKVKQAEKPLWNIDPNPPRFNWDGEKYVRVKNPKGTISLEYLNAAYESICRV